MHIAEGGDYESQNKCITEAQQFISVLTRHFWQYAVMCRFSSQILLNMNWKRYRLKTYAVSDNRPLIFNPEYPWWCSGYGEDDKGEYSVIIAYLPTDEDLIKYWDDAFDVEFTEEESISFSDRFPKPSYFVS